MSDLEQEIAGFNELSSADLRQRWARLTGSPVPRISPALLRLALAWELQARRLGGHSREVTRQLDQLARGVTRTTRSQPGMRLVREWQGRVHVVTIDEDQVIHWNDRSWGSLSEVAREITGIGARPSQRASFMGRSPPSVVEALVRASLPTSVGPDARRA